MDKILLFAELHPWWTTLWLFVIAGFPRAIAGMFGRKETVIIRERSSP